MDQGVSNDYGTSNSSPASATVDHIQTDPDDALALRAFDSFFRHVHHIAMFSFLHRPSLMERYHAASLDRALMLALVGITALLTDLGHGMEEYGNRCVEEAVSLCLADIEKPSIPRLQALVIVIKHRMLSKRFSGAFMLHAVASRFATALRLNHENPDLCFLARESRRRLMWSLYMMDSSLSAGQAEFALWADAERQIHVQLPCNERNFDFDLPEPTESLRPPSPGPGGVIPPLPDVLGLMALHIRIHWMRTRILQFTSRMMALPFEDALATLPSQCAELAAELEAFEARLPASFRGCEANFRLRSYSPRLGIFIMTHVWWRQCHLDLFRPFLPGLREALVPAALQQLDGHFVKQQRRSCYEHAVAMADMFSQLLALGSSALVADLDLPGCAFQCARVLYHGLQMDGGDMGFTQERVQELATVCLRAARQSTAGPASAAIVGPSHLRHVHHDEQTTYTAGAQQADIERLISSGLQLPEIPPAPPGRTRGSAAGMNNTPYLAQRIESTDHMQAASVQMPMGATTMSPMTALSLPMADTSLDPLAARSQASVGTSASNAFEEVADGLNFGPEMFGAESWSALSLGWADMGHFTSSNI
jgi:poly [ADP-ribose] polymerase